MSFQKETKYGKLNIISTFQVLLILIRFSLTRIRNMEFLMVDLVVVENVVKDLEFTSKRKITNGLLTR